MSTYKYSKFVLNSFPFSLFYLLFILSICVGCQSAADSSKNTSVEENKSIEKDMFRTSSLVTDYDEKTRQAVDEQKWILNITGEPILSSPLLLFYAKNQRYPYDMREFLDSGYLLAWPANPTNGKPMTLVENRKLSIEDIGIISYVRESDSNAYFEIVYYDMYDDETIVRKIPSTGTMNKTLSSINLHQSKGKLDIKIQNVFKTNMEWLINSAFMRAEYRSGEITPSGFAEAAHGNFLLIEENIKPSFISSDPEFPLFFEAGIAVLDGRVVEFYEYTFTVLTQSGKKIKRRFGRLPTDDEIVKRIWDRLWGAALVLIVMLFLVYLFVIRHL